MIKKAPIQALAATLLIGLTAPAALAAFDGDYVLDNWTLTTVDGGVTPSSGAAASITLIGNSGTAGFTDFVITVATDGIISFDWTYFTTDQPLFDTAGWVLNGARTDLANGVVSPIAANVSVAVSAGDVFGFYVESVDGIGDPGELTVDNFTVVPVPAAVWMFASALGLFCGVARRETRAG